MANNCRENLLQGIETDAELPWGTKKNAINCWTHLSTEILLLDTMAIKIMFLARGF